VPQSNLAEPDGVFPAIVAAASLRGGNPEERLSHGASSRHGTRNRSHNRIDH
jgi:hypothetical protein